MFKGQPWELHVLNEFTKMKGSPLLPCFSGRCVNDPGLHIAHRSGSLCVTVSTRQMLFRHIVKQRRSCTGIATFLFENAMVNF